MDNWTYAPDGGTCGNTQFGCPQTDCIDGRRGNPWCLAESDCATNEAINDEPDWTYCTPPPTLPPTPAPTNPPTDPHTSPPTNSPATPLTRGQTQGDCRPGFAEILT